MSNIEKIRVQMFKAYTWYRYEEFEGTSRDFASKQALAIDILYENCFGNDLLTIWQQMNDDTRQEVALECICDEEILALMGYLQVRINCRH